MTPPTTAQLPETIRHLHFVGMWGVGMSALAIISKGLGYVVTGSEVENPYGSTGESLAKAGLIANRGYRAEHITPDIDLVILGPAFGESNPEIQAAHALDIPVIPSSVWIGRLLEGRESIAVAGIHGKTTTTAWIATMLMRAQRDPTFLIGAGTVADLGTNAHAGQGKLIVVEADEYHVSQLDHRPKIWDMTPRVAIITSIEWDHPDVFPSLDAVREAFEHWMRQLPATSTLIVHGDDPQIQLALDHAQPLAKVIRFGRAETNDWSLTDDPARALTPPTGERTITFLKQGKPWLSTTVGLPGPHNLLNALAVVAVADEEGIPKDALTSALQSFHGAQRRFDVTEVGTQTWIDDYAHHPTAIAYTLKTVRERYPGRRVIAIFQPHTFSRTEALLDEFAGSFADADRVLLMPIFGSAREKTGTITSAAIRDRMPHPEGVLLPASHDEAMRLLQDLLEPRDVVLTIGAGDVYELGPRWREAHPHGA